MALWNSIACAVDDSDGSRAALGTAARLARQLDASLTLIHVDPSIPGEGGEAVFAPPPPRRILDLHRNQVGAWSAAASDIRGKPVRVQLATGDAAGEILAFARRERCDLLVMGTRARSRLTLAVGSVAAKVLVEAPCPVLVVAP